MDAEQETQDGARKRALLAQLVGAVYAMERQRKRGQINTGGRKRDKAARFLKDALRLRKRIWDGTHNVRAQELVLEDDESQGEDGGALNKVQKLGYRCENTSHGYGQEQGTIWYAVFVKEQAHTFGPAVVVAVRGTRISDLRDIAQDMAVLVQALHKHPNVLHLQDVVKQAVRDYGSANVCIAGHSLGAALGLLAAIELEAPVEAHLFNPPFASFDWVCSSKVRRVEKLAKAVLVKTQAAAGAVASSHDFMDGLMQLLCPRLEDIEKQFWALADWLPHLYLHPGDPISWGYMNFFDDQEKRIESERADPEGHRARLEGLVAPHTLFGVLSRFTQPKHLIPSAVVVHADTGPGLHTFEAHSLRQWENSHMPVRLRRIQSPFKKHKAQAHQLQEGVRISMEVRTRQLNYSPHESDHEMFESSGSARGESSSQSDSESDDGESTSDRGLGGQGLQHHSESEEEVEYYEDCEEQFREYYGQESGSSTTGDSEEEEPDHEDDAHAQDLKGLENLFSLYGL